LGAVQSKDFSIAIVSNDIFDGFRQSMAIGDTSSKQLVNSTLEMVKGYTLMLMEEGQSFNDAVEMANDHILGKQFAFLTPGFDDGYKVRIPRAEMENLEDGQFEDALTVAAQQALESIDNPAIRATAEDRIFRWSNSPLDTGLILYSQDPDSLLFVPVASEKGEITWSELRALASVVDELPDRPTGLGTFVGDVAGDVAGDVGETIKDAGSSALKDLQETADSIVESIQSKFREEVIDPRVESKATGSNIKILASKSQPKGLIPELMEEVDQALSAPVRQLEQKAEETGDYSADRDMIDRYVGTARAIIANAKDSKKARKAIDRLLEKAAQNLANIKSRQALDTEINRLFNEGQ